MDKAQFVKDLVKQNLNGVGEEDVRLVHRSPAGGRKSSVAVIEVPPDKRRILLNQGRVYLEWFSCRVTDHLHILQCFRCLGFGHIAKNCSAADDTCGHCGGKHESRACPKTGARKCYNCDRAKMSATNHSALDLSACPILQQKISDKSRMIQY